MNPEQELELLEQLMNELLVVIQEVLQSGEVLSDEFQGILAEELQYTTSRIEQLKSQQGSVESLPPNAPQNIPKLDAGPFDSSNVNSFKYDPNLQRLFVKFHGKDSANSGPVYLYENVPKNIYDVFSKGRVAPKTSGSNRYHTWIKGVTPSLGASLYALIRNGGFPFARMS